jgi:hypothetical protein
MERGSLCDECVKEQIAALSDKKDKKEETNG